MLARRARLGATVACLLACVVHAAPPNLSAAPDVSSTSKPSPQGLANSTEALARQKLEAEIAGLELANAKSRIEMEKLRAEVDDLKSNGDSKSALEKAKLKAEKSKIDAETRDVVPWWMGMAGIAAAAIAGYLGLTQNARERLQAFDAMLLEKRLEVYPDFFRETAPFAVFFPPPGQDNQAFASIGGERSSPDPSAKFISTEVCRSAGDRLRALYYGPAGAVMTSRSLKRYFALQRLLTGACAQGVTLRVPNAGQYAELDDRELDACRTVLGIQQKNEIDRCYEHRFASSSASPATAAATSTAPIDTSAEDTLQPARDSKSKKRRQAIGDETLENARRFEDFVMLQFAASRLRTELIRDMGARRPIKA